MKQEVTSANGKIEELDTANCCLKEEITQLQVRSLNPDHKRFESCKIHYFPPQASLNSSEDSLQRVTASGEKALKELRVSLAAREREVSRFHD